jgi:hypothetical protein
MRRAQWRQLYRRSRRQGDYSFSQKNVSFCFNHPHNPDTESRSQKGGCLQDFEVCGVPEKEPLHNKLNTINPFGTVICVKEK